MGTTVAQDNNLFAETESRFGTKRPSSGAGGTVNFAGAYWPPRTQAGASIKYHDVSTAIQEARLMILKGYQLSVSGLAGDRAASEAMTRWFGTRETLAAMAPFNLDWWQGASRIMGAIESFITKNVYVYYRGDATILGRPTDYPGMTGTLNAHDIAGYAESSVGTMNSQIGLCSVFFRKTTRNGLPRVNLRGIDTVGGTLVHELSHNLCKTDDHESADGSTCYGVAKCLELARDRPSRAWYNADNIEYFCEEALYGKTGVPTPRIVTSAASGVAALRSRFNR